MTFAERMQSERIERGMSIRAAATEIGTSPATLSRVENGRLPDVKTFAAMIAWAGINPNWALMVVQD